MISEETLQIARQTAEELRQRGEDERAHAIETLVDAAQEDALPSLGCTLHTIRRPRTHASGGKSMRLQLLRRGWLLRSALVGFQVTRRSMPSCKSACSSRLLARCNVMRATTGCFSWSAA